MDKWEYMKSKCFWESEMTRVKVLDAKSEDDLNTDPGTSR